MQSRNRRTQTLCLVPSIGYAEQHNQCPSSQLLCLLDCLNRDVLLPSLAQQGYDQTCHKNGPCWTLADLRRPPFQSSEVATGAMSRFSLHTQSSFDLFYSGYFPLRLPCQFQSPFKTYSRLSIWTHWGHRRPHRLLCNFVLFHYVTFLQALQNYTKKQKMLFNNPKDWLQWSVSPSRQLCVSGYMFQCVSVSSSTPPVWLPNQAGPGGGRACGTGHPATDTRKPSTVLSTPMLKRNRGLAIVSVSVSFSQKQFELKICLLVFFLLLLIHMVT